MKNSYVIYLYRNDDKRVVHPFSWVDRAEAEKRFDINIRTGVDHLWARVIRMDLVELSGDSAKTVRSHDFPENASDTRTTVNSGLSIREMIDEHRRRMGIL